MPHKLSSFVDITNQMGLCPGTVLYVNCCEDLQIHDKGAGERPKASYRFLVEEALERYHNHPVLWRKKTHKPSQVEENPSKH
jgi:hypothetical protein